MLNALVCKNDGNVLFIFDIEVIVELTVKFKFETVVIVEYEDKLLVSVLLNALVCKNDGNVLLIFDIEVIVELTVVVKFDILVVCVCQNC